MQQQQQIQTENAAPKSRLSGPMDEPQDFPVDLLDSAFSDSVITMPLPRRAAGVGTWNKLQGRQRGTVGQQGGAGGGFGGGAFGDGGGVAAFGGGPLVGSRNLPADAKQPGSMSPSVDMKSKLGVVDGILDGQHASYGLNVGYMTDGSIRWTQTGGLSLPIEIQRDGNVLRFSRASGTPRLALAVRPNESEKMGLGIVWTLVWGAIAIWLLRAITGSSRGCIVRQVGCGVCVLGLIGLFVLPSPLSGLSLLAFALSAVVLAIGMVRPQRQTTAV